MQNGRAKVTTYASSKAKPGLSAREAPLRVLPFETMIDMTCRDCGLSRSHSAGELVNQARFGSCTMVDLERTQQCARCKGSLALTIEGETLFSNGFTEMGDPFPVVPLGNVNSHAGLDLSAGDVAAVSGNRG